ncbi:unnamed protein product [Schistosoma spindalis]|nr:unnamed protein product [Schistosoma spindale]
MLNLIHPSGKISMYYEHVTEEIRKSESVSVVNSEFRCGEEGCPKHKSMKTCKDSTTSNTKCMWCENANMCIPSTDKNTHDFKVSLCQNKSSLIDVSSEPTLIEGEEDTTPVTTVADLRNELRQTTENTETHSNSSNISVSNGPTLIEDDKTTPTSTVTDLRTELKQTTENTETHSNVTTQMNEDKKQGESRNYAYIIVPVVVTFIVICIVCAIGIWFYRKKKSIPCLSQTTSCLFPSY